MIIKTLIDEDFVNYKKCCMFIAMPKCSGKCWRELNLPPSICQNDHIRNQPDIEISSDEIIKRYLANPISHAICFGGLEPFDSLDEVLDFIIKFRKVSDDDIVIYSGYNADEIQEALTLLKEHSIINIYIKLGRYHPEGKKKYCPVLGVALASENQYAIGGN